MTVNAWVNLDKTPYASNWLCKEGATSTEISSGTAVITPQTGVIYLITGSCDDAGYTYTDLSPYEGRSYTYNGSQYVLAT